MTDRLRISQIWWRNVQLGEFYNIERFHRIRGGGGALYIEIPTSMVPATLRFLGVGDIDVESFEPITIQAKVVGDPGVSGPIEFQPKKGRRMRIARQNRQQPNSQRHPAWTSRYGFPRAPDDIRTREEAMPYFPDGGLRIYIAKTGDGEFYAGHTKGLRPAHLKPTDPMWQLYSQTSVGGVIDAE